MRKKEKRIVGIIVGIILVGIILANQGILPLTVVGDSFTPIFCNDYEFTCCNEKQDSFIQSFSITDEKPFQCPLTSTKCEIGGVSISSGLKTYIGIGNCQLDSSIFGERFKCVDEVQSTRTTLFPGEYIWVMNPLTKTFNVNGLINDISVKIDRLDFCGRSGCSVGVPVSGADQCTFHPLLDKVYTSTSSLTGKVSTTSYTVPSSSCVLAFQSGDRHICGYLEESCSTDYDCGGHTYGTKECIARTLQTYGCRSFGQTVFGHDRGPFDSGWGSDNSATDSNTFGKRCEIVSAQQVQCCGDSDCGSNMFCDTSTFTCQSEVECTQDSDCGVSVQCDFSIRKLKTPICSSGTCDYKEEDVGCCNDQQCPSDSFCNVERECEQRQITKTQCPFECCVEDERYFYRACPDIKPYCIDGGCNSEPPELDSCDSCDNFAKSTLFGSIFKSQKCDNKFFHTFFTCVFSFIKFFLVPIILIFVTLFGYNFFQTNKKLKIRNKGLAFTISLILGALLAWLTFILFSTGIIISVIALIVIIALKRIL